MCNRTFLVIKFSEVYAQPDFFLGPISLWPGGGGISPPSGNTASLSPNREWLFYPIRLVPNAPVRFDLYSAELEESAGVLIVCGTEPPK